MATVQLRTRYYHAQFIIYRPYLWKALHHPEDVNSEDRMCCGMAIKTACRWPVALPPAVGKKRLVPHVFAWTQNFMSILLIFKLCSVNTLLQEIINEGEVVSREEVESTIKILMDWMNDVRQVDVIAEWAWGILAPLYGYGQSV